MGQPVDLSCKGRGGCESQCYLHSYNGFPTNTTSFYGGIAASAKAAGEAIRDCALFITHGMRVCGVESDAAADQCSRVAGASVTYAIGANLTCPQVTRSGGAVADFTCLDSQNASGFYSPAAADAIAAAVAAAKSADVTVLAVGLGAIMEAEGNDRVNLTLPSNQRALLDAVGKAAKKLVLVVVSAGASKLTRISRYLSKGSIAKCGFYCVVDVALVCEGGVDLDESQADAVLWAPYGGEEAGSGLADVLWRNTPPSGRMPVTVYHQAWADAMNCKNFTESPARPRKYNADCDTSILQVQLLADRPA